MNYVRGNWKAILAAAVAAVAALAGSANAPSAPTRPAVSLNPLSRDLLVNVNALRKSHGLTPLCLSVSLNAAAEQHSTEMARVGYFAHESANGGAFDKRLARFYPMGPRHVLVRRREPRVVGTGPERRRGAQALDGSPPHRENLLASRWREIGISAVHADSAPGSYAGGPATIITADFGVRR